MLIPNSNMYTYISIVQILRTLPCVHVANNVNINDNVIELKTEQ